MLGLRQAFRLSLRLTDGLCLNALSSYQQQCRQRLNKFAIYESISRQFSVDANSATKECDLEENKIAKQPLGKLERRLMIQFTCKKCGTRNSNTMTKLAYEKGVVIICCDGCKNNHLIADNLGWFGPDTTKRNIEKMMKLNGESVKRISAYDNKICEVVKREELLNIKDTDEK